MEIGGKKPLLVNLMKENLELKHNHNIIAFPWKEEV